MECGIGSQRSSIAWLTSKHNYFVHLYAQSLRASISILELYSYLITQHQLQQLSGFLFSRVVQYYKVWECTVIIKASQGNSIIILDEP